MCALALIIPMSLIGLGQLGAPQADHQAVRDAGRDTRSVVDPATQPQPTNTVAPSTDDFAMMFEPTPEGALAATHHFFAQYAYMIATGDTSGWQEASAPECVACLAFSSQSADLHAQGGWIVGGDITLVDPDVTLGTVGDGLTDAISRTPGASDDGAAAPADPALAGQVQALITSQFSEAQATLVDDPTREPQVRPASSDGTFILTMRHDGTRWLITDMHVA